MSAPEELCYRRVVRDPKVRGRYVAKSLWGTCVEASVAMHKCLTEMGVRAELILRNMGTKTDWNSHFTVKTERGEFDATIAWWPKHDRPRDAVPRKLYKVGPKSPHRRWPKDYDSDVAWAYGVYGCELPEALR